MTEEMDVEALQAQIDLSNSIAYNLVSSWMKPTASTSTVSHTISRELEEYAKRPPRLGLGATVSKSSFATSREASILKGKLTGQKRPRDEGGDVGPEAENTIAVLEDVDEGESRSAAISSKKVQVNGVRGLRLRDLASPSTRPTVALHSPSASKNRKKKHKKKHKHEGNEDNTAKVDDDEWTGFSNHSLEIIDTAVGLDEESLSQPRPLDTVQSPSTPTHISTETSKHPVLSPSIIDLTSPVRPTPSPPHPQHTSPFPPPPAPLLNLHGPPMVDTNVGADGRHVREVSESPKKKKARRRRGRARKSHGDGGDA